MSLTGVDGREYVTGPDIEAAWHLGRAAELMATADDPDQPVTVGFIDAVFRRAEVHARIGLGYATLAAAHAPPAVVAPPTPPPDVYPNG